MTNEVLLKSDGVGKKFCSSLKKSLWYAVKDMASELRGSNDYHRSLRDGEFWAVDDASFELRRGECLGLIGHNGAGKTTLLKILNGILKPDRGRIEIRGRTGALIALGAGFNPILTGRENIYVNGSVLGMSKRHVDAKLEEIVDFAEIGEFIDSPVQNYSSGMNVRLGFSVAAVLMEPDILFLDEVLAVGDIGFTIKCLNKVRQLTERAAVIFVSHNMQFVSTFCSRVIVMERGRSLLDASDPAEGIDRYYSMVTAGMQCSGTGEAKVFALTLSGDDGEMPVDPEPRIVRGQSISVLLDLEVQGPSAGAHLHLYVMDEGMTSIMCFPVHAPPSGMFIAGPGRHRLRVPLGPLELSAGKYTFVVSVADKDTKISLTRVQGLCPFRIFDDRAYWGKIVRPVLASSRHSPHHNEAVSR